MYYEDILHDFVKRTISNLYLIEAEKEKGNVNAFEATQLFNSLLGILVMPSERYFNKIPNYSIQDLKNKGWPIPVVHVKYELNQPRTLNKLIKYLRNAVAHFNISFGVDSKKEISYILVKNFNLNIKEVDWEAEISIVDLRILILKFAELLLNITNDQRIKNQNIKI